ncbi:MAG: TRAP transporter substrate-binding protein [Anaerotruncus sp.]|nr:TRAP transporter substrate-binding protein [Anaerotruncus sp.]
MLKKLLLVLVALALCVPALAEEKKARSAGGLEAEVRPEQGRIHLPALQYLPPRHRRHRAPATRSATRSGSARKGRLYVDFRPLAQLGGEKDVISKLKLGAVQGMMSSSVAAANVSDKLGIVNLPYVVDTFDKLDTFRNTPELWNEFRDAALPQGIMAVDITGYGPYGWATTTPVKTIADAKTVNFRIAEAPVNTDIYKAWGLKFTVMPWPDVDQALQTGVISGLDHTPIVCNITKKFEIAKNFTQLDYAQGLFVHLMNKKWFDKLPADLQKVLIDTIVEESAATARADPQAVRRSGRPRPRRRALLSTASPTPR